MNSDDQIKKNPESDTGLIGNLGGPMHSLACLDEKKSLPMLYVPQTTGNNNKQDLGNDTISTSNSSFPIPKITGTASLAQNGKFVHVQQSNSNAVLVGTLLRSSPKGQEVIPHKVLLTAVKSKDSSPMTRLILPRPSSNSQQLAASSSTKQFCRSINMIPCTQGTLMTSAIAVKTAEGTSKLIQPNIFRQRTMDGKIITTSSGIPISGGIIVPGKSPPPTLTLIKSSKTGQSPTSERKFVVLDMKEREKPIEKPLVESKSELESTSCPELNCSTTDDKITVNTEVEVTSINPEGTDGSRKTADSEAIIKIQSRCPDLVVKKVGPEVVVKVPSTPPALIPRKLISSPEAVSKKIMDEKSSVFSDKPEELTDTISIISSSSEKLSTKTSSMSMKSSAPEVHGEGLLSALQRDAPMAHEKTVSLLGGSQKRPVTSLVTRDSVSSPREATSAPSEGRARKRKGSLNSAAVSSPSKNRAVLDSYENMKLLPGAENLNPFKAIEWDDNGIGLLPESEIKIVLNDFGMLELKASMKQLEKNRHGKIDDSEEIFCCVQCRCYGLISEFFNESYCSLSCKEELMAQQLSLVNLEDIEPLEINYCKEKKKNSDNSSIKKPLIVNEMLKNKSMPNNSSTVDEEYEDFMEEDVVNVPVTDSDIDDKTSSSQKSLNIESTSHKIKKLLPKTNKPSSKLLKSPKPSVVSSSTSQETGNKSKIKLRPRSVIKNNKYAEEFVAQDLDAGSPVTEKSDNSKKQSGFRWSTYLNQTKAIPVWVKLFKNPYPSKPNRFKVGQRLEAIDPEHQSYFCLVSVAEVRGYRLKLHFDGYPSDYDFWVNADSPNIFPPEFCSSHGIPLYPPPGIPVRSFDWNIYLTRNNVKAAPAAFFETSTDPAKPNLFKVDMKLEAVDRKNTYLVCVATVAAVMENRILIHFDSWGDMYDYWVDVTSPYIRPVGWCQNNYHELTPPNGIDPEHFSWKRYLKDTKSIAAPEKAFILRQPIEFKKGMKIEAVDKRAPHLIRVATISAVLPYQLHITFDGFPPHFGYWVDDDSPDIHPIGWASRAGHPLEPPPTTEDLLKAPCKSPGCVGQGYLKGTKYETHTELEDCPYTTEHLSKDTSLNNRLKWSFAKCRKYGEEFCTIPDDSDEESDDEMENLRWAWLKEAQNLHKNSKRIPEKECKEICKSLIQDKSSRPLEEKKSFKNTASQTSMYKFELITNNVTNLEEVKTHFRPTSPIIKSEELSEKNNSDVIKAEERDPKNTNIITGTSGSSINELKDEFMNVEIKEVKKEINLENQLNFEEKSDNFIKVEEMNDSILDKASEVKMEVDEPLTCSDDNNMELSTPSEPEIMESKVSYILSPTNKKLDTEESLDDNVEIRNSSDISVEDHDISSEKVLLEEKNVLRWTISQVSQFTRPLITSCSQDCFLKEGIDGAGLLMLNKNDLLEYLGLSDSDAERVFSKISSLRQKAY